ncbi:MAG TPA: mannose-1-phosphate guanylyltransferase/mannose-6-phosphate isomerase [Alphaproteobacteria bacterium]|jgi:mannose-1-phosphate guanylyltransferase/mannose-6-phosphate isomerase
MAESSQHKIRPVILAGGTGTRLWPMSRLLSPKQFMPLAGPATMLAETVGRVVDPARFLPPIVLCNEEYRFIVAEQLRGLGIKAEAIVLEPVARNTAPAVAVAALLAAAVDPETPLLLLPADHVIAATGKFHAAIATALPAAVAGKLMTFGIPPSRPETGYGYIHRGGELGGQPGCYAVDRFVEKPDAATAERYVSEGGYDWNSGMFLFRADRYLAELARLQPDIAAACQAAIDKGANDLDFFRLDQEAFSAAPSISIDYAVMEHTKDAAVVPADIGWNDVGAWDALWQIAPKDPDGNVALGDVLAVDTKNSYLRSEGGKLLATVGVDNLVVVVTDDAVLVTDINKAQDVKKIVEELNRQGREETKAHTTVFRPWGSYRGIDVGERHQVKHIMVKPGGQLSLQWHHHRAEHWVVVSGRAQVTRGEEIIMLNENESIYIPIGTQHRLENPGKMPLHLIEVQSGGYLGEDDIVRIEDTYGRT